MAQSGKINKTTARAFTTWSNLASRFVACSVSLSPLLVYIMLLNTIYVYHNIYLMINKVNCSTDRQPRKRNRQTICELFSLQPLLPVLSFVRSEKVKWGVLLPVLPFIVLFISSTFPIDHDECVILIRRVRMEVCTQLCMSLINVL